MPSHSGVFEAERGWWVKLHDGRVLPVVAWAWVALGLIHDVKTYPLVRSEDRKSLRTPEGDYELVSPDEYHAVVVRNQST